MVTEHLRFFSPSQKQNIAASNSLDLGELILWQTENGENTFLVHKRTAHTSTEGSSNFAAVPNYEVGTQSCKKEFCLGWIEGCTVKDFFFFFFLCLLKQKMVHPLKQKMVNFFLKWKNFCSGGLIFPQFLLGKTQSTHRVKGGDPSSHLSTGEAHLECCVQFWAP